MPLVAADVRILATPNAASAPQIKAYSVLKMAQWTLPGIRHRGQRRRRRSTALAGANRWKGSWSPVPPAFLHAPGKHLSRRCRGKKRTAVDWVANIFT